MAEFTETKTITVDCPDCASDRVVKIGQRNNYQRYLCRACEKKFNTEDKPYNHRVPAEVIAAAIDMYYSGLSYKQIAENLEKTQDMEEPSKETIYRWVRDFSLSGVEDMQNYPGPHQRALGR